MIVHWIVLALGTVLAVVAIVSLLLRLEKRWGRVPKAATGMWGAGVFVGCILSALVVSLAGTPDWTIFPVLVVTLGSVVILVLDAALRLRRT